MLSPLTLRQFQLNLQFHQAPKSDKKTRQHELAGRKNSAELSETLLLPRTLLVAVGLEALPAFMFRHLQTSFLLKISHGVKRLMKGQRARGLARCKA
jgi:hypothetical protein